MYGAVQLECSSGIERAQSLTVSPIRLYIYFWRTWLSIRFRGSVVVPRAVLNDMDG